MGKPETAGERLAILEFLGLLDEPDLDKLVSIRTFEEDGVLLERICINEEAIFRAKKKHPEKAKALLDQIAKRKNEK